jgi:hypothetical protein
MNAIGKTQGGTLVFEPSAEEFDAFLEEQIQGGLNLTTAEFEEGLRAKSLDLDDPIVSELAALLQTRS